MGAIPPNTQLYEFMAGRAVAPHTDSKNAESRRIDRVVFVASIREDVQENLFQNVLKIIRGNEGELPCKFHSSVIHSFVISIACQRYENLF